MKFRLLGGVPNNSNDSLKTLEVDNNAMIILSTDALPMMKRLCAIVICSIDKCITCKPNQSSYNAIMLSASVKFMLMMAAASFDDLAPGEVGIPEL